MSNSLDPYQVRTECQPDLGPICLQRLSADDMSGKVLMQKVRYNGFDPKLSEPGKTFFLFDSLRPINNLSVI